MTVVTTCCTGRVKKKKLIALRVDNFAYDNVSVGHDDILKLDRVLSMFPAVGLIS